MTHTAFKAPFYKDGSLAKAAYHWEAGGVEWHFFEYVTLKLHDPILYRGQNPYWVWREEGSLIGTGRRFPMFLTDMQHLMENATIDHGRVSGQFSVQKRGTHYGIRLEVKDEQE